MHRERTGWWNRNWYWALPGGCLGCLGLVLGSCVVMVGGLVGSLRGSTPFDEAVARARADARVIEALGQPIRTRWMISGNLQLSDRDGEADFVVPVSGPKNQGELRVDAVRRNEVWTFRRLELLVDDQADPIDLLLDDLPSLPEAVPEPEPLPEPEPDVDPATTG